MEQKVNGLVIKSVNYGENDKILTIFTMEKGVICAKIKGVKKAGAKLKFSAEPFCFAEYVLSVKGNFSTVTGASLHDSFYPLRENIINYYAGAIILEFIKKFCPENTEFSQLFLQVISALKDLAYGENKAIFVLVKFVIQALSAIGYATELDKCFACGEQVERRAFFNFEDGAIYCENCATEKEVEISVNTYYALRDILNGEVITESKYLIRAFNMLMHYLGVKTGEKISSVDEFLKFIC